MKLRGYYMAGVAKTELGITDVIVFDVKTRAELVNRLDEVHPNVCRLYDFKRYSFNLNVKPNDATDAAALAARLGLPPVSEVL